MGPEERLNMLISKYNPRELASYVYDLNRRPALLSSDMTLEQAIEYCRNEIDEAFNGMVSIRDKVGNRELLSAVIESENEGVSITQKLQEKGLGSYMESQHDVTNMTELLTALQDMDEVIFKTLQEYAMVVMVFAGI